MIYQLKRRFDLNALCDVEFVSGIRVNLNVKEISQCFIYLFLVYLIVQFSIVTQLWAG